MSWETEKKYLQELWVTIPRAATVKFRKDHPTCAELINRLPGKTFAERAWLFVSDLAAVPLCCVCNTNTVPFRDISRGYAKYCSTKCLANSTEVLEKKKITCMEKYGVAHHSKTSEYKEKFKSTCLTRYGVSNPGQIDNKKVTRARSKQLTFFKAVIEQAQSFSCPLFTFDQYTHVRDHNLQWQCAGCKQPFTSNLLDKLPKCPVCYPIGNIGGQSKIEKDVLGEIRKFYTGEIIENSREIISPKELDLYFPELKFAIEINGLYWHSDLHVEKNYHYEKYVACTSAGIKLLMITDEEWQNKRSVVISMIRHRLHQLTTKVHARQCTVSPITVQQSREFLACNHLHGFSPASVHLGLFFNQQLVSVLTLSKQNRFDRKNQSFEIIRFALSCSVTGAMGKFIKYIQREYHDCQRIITYADLRYGPGQVYLLNGFKFVKNSKPGYWYFINNQLYHRLSWTKKRLVDLGYPASKTEFEIMDDLKALRIYDCGHACYQLELQ